MDETEGRENTIPQITIRPGSQFKIRPKQCESQFESGDRLRLFYSELGVLKSYVGELLDCVTWTAYLECIEINQPRYLHQELKLILHPKLLCYLYH